VEYAVLEVQQQKPRKSRSLRALRIIMRVGFMMFFISLVSHLQWHDMYQCNKHMTILSDPDYQHSYERDSVAGFTVEGTIATGVVKFESSKVKKQYDLQVDLAYSNQDLADQVEWIVKDNKVTLSVPSTGDGHINVTAVVNIPSDILIGHESLPGFVVAVTDFSVDYSSLGSKVEIDEWSVSVAKGNVKVGPLASNTTSINVANGRVSGDLALAREKLDIKIASGDAKLKTSKSPDGTNEMTINAANGNITGSYLVEKSLDFNVANGNLYVDVDISQNSSLSSNCASGLTRVYVNKLEDDPEFSASHTSISGSMVLTYPESFIGVVTCRNVMGDIDLKGKDLKLKKQWFGYEATKGTDGKGEINVKTFKGDIDFLIGKEA